MKINTVICNMKCPFPCIFQQSRSRSCFKMLSIFFSPFINLVLNYQHTKAIHYHQPTCWYDFLKHTIKSHVKMPLQKCWETISRKGWGREGKHSLKLLSSRGLRLKVKGLKVKNRRVSPKCCPNETIYESICMYYMKVTTFQRWGHRVNVKGHKVNSHGANLG